MRKCHTPAMKYNGATAHLHAPDRLQRAVVHSAAQRDRPPPAVHAVPQHQRQRRRRPRHLRAADRGAGGGSVGGACGGHAGGREGRRVSGEEETCALSCMPCAQLVCKPACWWAAERLPTHPPATCHTTAAPLPSPARRPVSCSREGRPPSSAAGSSTAVSPPAAAAPALPVPAAASSSCHAAACGREQGIGTAIMS